jgi:capsule polysaccharide export protein KpsE/RkpR
LNPIELIEKLNQALLALQRGNTQLQTLGVKKADAERKYKISLRQELLKLRLEKHPVSIIQDLAKGNEEISKLRLERDLAENAYTTCQEAMRNIRLEIETLRSFLTYQRVELKNT